MTRSAMTARAPRCCWPRRCSSGRARGPKSTRPRPPREGAGGTDLQQPATTPIARRSTTTRAWMKSHGQVAVSDQRTCELCHQASSCADCHGNKEEIKPSTSVPAASTRRRRTAATTSPSTGSTDAWIRLPASPATDARTMGRCAHMSQVRQSFTAAAVGFALLAALAVGCSKKSGAAFDPDAGHPDDWVTTHPDEYRSAGAGRAPSVTATINCGGISTVSCSSGFPRRPGLSPGRSRGPSSRLARAALGGSVHSGDLRRLPRQQRQHPAAQLLQQQSLSWTEVRPPLGLAGRPFEHRPVAGVLLRRLPRQPCQ